MEGSSGKDSGCADEAGNKPRSLRRNKGAFAVGIGRISPLFTGWGEKIGFFFLLVLSWVPRGWWCRAGFGPLAPGANWLLLSRGQRLRWSWG